MDKTDVDAGNRSKMYIIFKFSILTMNTWTSYIYKPVNKIFGGNPFYFPRFKMKTFFPISIHAKSIASRIINVSHAISVASRIINVSHASKIILVQEHLCGSPL